MVEGTTLLDIQPGSHLTRKVRLAVYTKVDIRYQRKDIREQAHM
jgi:hypothetical protein